MIGPGHETSTKVTAMDHPHARRHARGLRQRSRARKIPQEPDRSSLYLAPRRGRVADARRTPGFARRGRHESFHTSDWDPARLEAIAFRRLAALLEPPALGAITPNQP